MSLAAQLQLGANSLNIDGGGGTDNKQASRGASKVQQQPLLIAPHPVIAAPASTAPHPNPIKIAPAPPTIRKKTVRQHLDEFSKFLEKKCVLITAANRNELIGEYEQEQAALEEVKMQVPAPVVSKNNHLRTCMELGCVKRRSFGPPGEKPQYCGVHKKTGQVDVAHKRRCEHEGCDKHPGYGNKGEKRRFCAAHKLQGMTDLKRGKRTAGEALEEDSDDAKPAAKERKVQTTSGSSTSGPRIGHIIAASAGQGRGEGMDRKMINILPSSVVSSSILPRPPHVPNTKAPRFLPRPTSQPIPSGSDIPVRMSHSLAHPPQTQQSGAKHSNLLDLLVPMHSNVTNVNTSIDASMDISTHNIQQQGSSKRVEQSNTPHVSSLVNNLVPSVNTSMHTSMDTSMEISTHNIQQQRSSQRVEQPNSLDILTSASVLPIYNNDVPSINTSMHTSKNNIQQQGSSQRVEQSHTPHVSSIVNNLVPSVNTDMNTSMNTDMNASTNNIEQGGNQRVAPPNSWA